MKHITIIGLVLSAGLVLSFRYNRYDKSRVSKFLILSDKFVTFSIDEAKPGNIQNKRLDFYYFDSLAYGHPVVIGRGTKLLLNTPTLLFEANDKQTPYLIYPGEKINIKYAESDSVQFYIQGNQQRTNELNFFRKLVQKTGNIYYGWKVIPYHRKVRTLNNLHALENEINDLKNTRLRFLYSVSSESFISSNFIKIANNAIKSTAFTDSLILYCNNRALLIKQNVFNNLISEKTNTIKEIGFLPFQTYYKACTTLVSVATSNFADYLIRNNDDFIKRVDFIQKNFNGTTKDFLMANTLFTAYDNDIPVSKFNLDKFYSKQVDEGYKRLVYKKLHEINTIAYPKGSDNLLLADGKTVKNMRSIISNYKGKIVLLDFWASWCGPCRLEMPYADKLKKKYTNKDVAIVTISSDINIENWLKANKEESLSNDNSFLLLKFDKSLFKKVYSINTIPRYLLLNKNGQVVNDDAPRPSDPKLSKLIDKYL